ncbi:MAG: hypothetical protein DHS20C01_35250 [marine bacterium B5-7]|nr:MAG: hypothetical protein DHS20C01_35250 [marine bacterium B5-7]
MNPVKAESRSAIRIATVYSDSYFRGFRACDMSLVRWLRISEALACAGYSVDMVINLIGTFPIEAPNLRQVSFDEVKWDKYHVIKTLFHQGFETLMRADAHQHPFIISKLGSVVGRQEATSGVYFFGDEHRGLLNIQSEIACYSKYVSILTRQSEDLWKSLHESPAQVLIVPTGVDRYLPRPGINPYSHIGQKIAVYIGNIYTDTQRDINRLWQNRLNELGAQLRPYEIRLCLVGPGDTSQLDPELVTYMGAIDQDRIWDYFYYADVGLSLAQGLEQHNESSKIYYYLRAGLPVVSEAPVPNNWLLEESGLGFVAPYGEPGILAERIHEASIRKWDFERGTRYILDNHTWNHRADIYQNIIDATIAVNR